MPSDFSSAPKSGFDLNVFPISKLINAHGTDKAGLTLVFENKEFSCVFGIIFENQLPLLCVSDKWPVFGCFLMLYKNNDRFWFGQ